MVLKQHRYCSEAESGIGDPWRALPTVSFVFALVLLSETASGIFLIDGAGLDRRSWSVLVKKWN